MPLSIDKLTPYLSVIILKIDNLTFDINSLKKELCKENGTFENEDLSNNGKVYFFNYKESKSVLWTNDPNIKDKINHIMIVYKFDNYLAIYHSDNSKKNKLYRLMFRSSQSHEFRKLKLIKKEVLHTAFLGGKIKNLWLQNINKTSEIKADSKILSGINLEKSLDPIGDQTYSFSAIKVQDSQDSSITIGLNASDSKLWMKKFSNSNDYFDTLHEILKKIKDIDTQGNIQFQEVPILANSHLNVTSLGNIIDIQLEDKEKFLSDSEEYNRLNAIDDEWENYNFNYSFATQSNVYELRRGTPQGDREYKLKFTVKHNQVYVELQFVDYREKNIALVLENKNLIKVYFENQQVFSNGYLYKFNYKDVFFNGFKWFNFTNFDITKEKPAGNDFTQIGQQNEDSLFSWVYKYWKGYTNNLVDTTQQFVSGWLLCDDGAGEKADFIHVSDEQDPTITLIHVKGANSNSGRIAITPYEIVVSQAVKNIRYLEKDTLIETIESANTNVINLVWENGQVRTRNNFKQYIENLQDYKKRIVVLQPHVSENAYDNPTTPSSKIQKNLLNALLVSAQSTVQGLGAEFVVIGRQ